MSTAPPTPARSPIIPVAVIAGAAVVLLAFGPTFVGYFRPPPGGYADFVQEWMSARNYLTGHPVYERQRAACLRHFGRDVPEFDEELPWNAHPPVAVLLALPFGVISDYAAAHAVWNVLTFALFIVGVILIARELSVPLGVLSVAGAVMLLVCWQAMFSQLFQGQLNCLLLFLLTVTWIANRRDYQTAAGIAAGTAAAAKLFPGLLLVYFVATRRWRAALVTVLTGAVLHLAALAVFGLGTFETYLRDVMPSLEVFRRAWLNISLTGYWTRVGITFGAPAVGKVAALALQLAVVALVWRAGRRAPDRDARDRAFALTVFGMALASPIAWTHYLVFLTLPLMIVWRRPPRGAVLALLVVATATLWLPERFVPELFAGVSSVPTNGNPRPADPATAVFGLGSFTLALVVLFLVTAFSRPAAPAATSPDSPAQ